MSKLSFLEKLLDGVEVAWLPLGDVTQYEQPTEYLVTSTNYSDEFVTPVLTAGKTFILGYTDEVSGIYKASETPVIIFDDFTTANKWVDFDFKAKSSAMKMISSSDEDRFLSKYVYYWLNTLPSELVDCDHKRQWIGNYSNKKIPIPCPENPKKSLEIQAEIVRILDTFTELTAELTAELAAELTARKKQYEYYRTKLLTFSDVERERARWVTLGEIGELIRGNGLQKKDFVESGVGCIHYGQIYTYYGTFADKTKSFVSDELAKKLKKVNQGDLVIASTSENIEDVCKVVAWLGEEEVVTGGHATIFKHRQNPKYLAYYFQTPTFFDQKKKYAKGAKVIDVSAKDLAKIKIQLPEMSEQARIVAILDKFDALVNDISTGLPAEIEARRKQYEYYRSKLLTFEPLVN